MKLKAFVAYKKEANELKLEEASREKRKARENRV